MNNILKSATEIEPMLIEIRRHLHQHPELALDLPETVGYIKQKLLEMGIPFQEICPSGLVVTLGKGEHTILLRADMDALPTKEYNNLPFKAHSHNGHLCGHDLHATILLGAAKLLKEKEQELCGVVKLMFQPGEESGTGAKAMVAAGILENPKVDAALAFHVDPLLETGYVGYKKGVATSSMDSFYVNIQGKGGHSSTPHLAVDPLMIVTSIYFLLSTLVSKEISPFETAVLTIGKCGGGDVANVIPDTATLQGSFRCYSNDVRKHLEKRVYEIIADVTRTLRGTYTLQTLSTPLVYNNEVLCDQMHDYMAQIVGDDHVEIRQSPMTGSEDFSYISSRIPSMFAWLGAGHKENFPIHNPNVIFDESALKLGAATLANCAMHWLKDKQSI